MSLNRRTFLVASAAAAPVSAQGDSKTHSRFETWDVFTKEAFLGNPLAVFPDASGIEDSKLASIAREMAHSETTFVYPKGSATERAQGVRVRIFSRAGAELPFAGHPVLGTAFALWTANRARTDPQGNSITLSLPVGPILVVFRSRQGGWEGEMTQPAPVFAEAHDAKRLAPMLGLRIEDIEVAPPVENVSTGRPNLLIMVKTREAVRKASFDWLRLDEYFSTGDKERGVYLMTRDVENGKAQFHARKVSRFGDDPVTGSAAGCAIAWLVKHGLVESGKHIVIEQGSEVLRRGELLVSADLINGTVKNVRVGGSAVRSASGSLALF